MLITHQVRQPILWGLRGARTAYSGAAAGKTLLAVAGRRFGLGTTRRFAIAASASAWP